MLASQGERIWSRTRSHFVVALLEEWELPWTKWDRKTTEQMADELREITTGLAGLEDCGGTPAGVVALERSGARGGRRGPPPRSEAGAEEPPPPKARKVSFKDGTKPQEKRRTPAQLEKRTQ